MSYSRAGVSLNRAAAWVSFLRTLPSRSSHRKHLISGIGPFASASFIPKQFGKHPILLTACDGVGTKLKYPISKPQQLKVMGQDLVAMNVNDISACGAIPFLFLDYLACGRLEPKTYKWVLIGMNDALNICNVMLVGGETAEMPICYKSKDFDLAGFVLGLSNKQMLFKPHKSIKKGDVLIGLPSNGIHSNGYTLIHKLFSKQTLKKHTNLFYRPTQLYTPITNALIKTRRPPKAAAHITGGGLIDNLGRILRPNLSAQIDTTTWKPSEVFKRIQQKSKLSKREMFKTFNMGIGFVLVSEPKHADKILKICQKHLPHARVIGEITRRTHQVVKLT